METSTNNEYIIGSDLEEPEDGENNDAWNRVISGTKRNKDGSPNLGDVSDGYHTFNELYHHRGVLFFSLCCVLLEKSWFSELHSDGTMFEGMFIAGISTPWGSITYHFEKDEFFEMFSKSNIQYLEKAPEWDGASPEDGLRNIVKLTSLRSDLI